MTAFVLALLERSTSPSALLDRLVRAARDYGDRSAVGVFLAERAWTACAPERSREPRPTPPRRSVSPRDATRARGHAPIAASSAVLAGLERERPLEELEAAILRALPPAGDPDTVVQDDLALARVGPAARQRRRPRRRRRRPRAGPRGLLGLPSSPTLLPWRSAAALALAQLGEEERALELAQEELRLAEQLGTPRAVGIAQRAVALAGPARRAPGAAWRRRSRRWRAEPRGSSSRA